MNNKIDPSFWKGKKVFLTGHTGFKGCWLSTWLSSMGAELYGFSLRPSTNPNLFEVANINSLFYQSKFADIRDIDLLRSALMEASPDVVIHMAAQSLVKFSYEYPVETYATNVMGTVNLLDSIRGCSSVKSVLIITTDKCYENKEWVWGYRELDSLGGYDPYSNSKACAEMVVATYRQSFFTNQNQKKTGLQIATCRAGNVIGGGDWSQDRLIPDALAAFEAKEPLLLRNPFATRPWQHVLEPLSGYLLLAQALYQKDALFDGAWNFGPNDGKFILLSMSLTCSLLNGEAL
jgi:CDP-glucose 4,6-dehydratase